MARLPTHLTSFIGRARADRAGRSPAQFVAASDLHRPRWCWRRRAWLWRVATKVRDRFGMASSSSALAHNGDRTGHGGSLRWRPHLVFNQLSGVSPKLNLTERSSRRESLWSSLTTSNISLRHPPLISDSPRPISRHSECSLQVGSPCDSRANRRRQFRRWRCRIPPARLSLADLAQSESVALFVQRCTNTPA